MASASSIFLASKRYSSGLLGIPDGFLEQCSNLSVLVLSCCAFNFVSPPFLHCGTLKFLGLDHCKSNSILELQGGGYKTKWACLENLWVIDLRYTDWVEIFHEEKMKLMANLMEVNIEGVRCSQLTSQLKKRLPCLERLRIINPVYEAETPSSSADINDIFEDKTDLQLLDLSGNKEMKNLPTSISNAGQLEVLILDGCYALEDVIVLNRLPSSLRSFSFDGYGPAAPSRASTIELPLKSSRPVDRGMEDVKTSVISLEGCTQLDHLFLRGLHNLVELDLSGCAIKVLDFETMVTDVPWLKLLFLLGCEHLRAIKWGPASKQLDLLCIDTRPARKVLGCARPSLAVEHKPFRLQMHACIVDARLARSLMGLSSYNRNYYYSNISITSSMASSSGVVQPEKTSKKMTGPIDQQHYGVAGIYGDVFSKVGDALTTMQAFPQPPTQQWNYHIEIGDGSHSVESEVKTADGKNLGWLMAWCTDSLHVHDVSTCRHALPAGPCFSLRWCRVERCSHLDVIFPPGANDDGLLETIWASDLLKARCIWGRGIKSDRYLRSLRHLHLRSCPSLQFALPMVLPSFRSLETLHIIHCDDLRHIFLPDTECQSTSIKFTKLTTIHLHNLPALQQICEAVEMVAPALETIWIRGCWSLRRLPALKLKGRSQGKERPAIEVEKDVWDALEWDGVDAGHHPSLFQPPQHSCYYKNKRMPRGSLLRRNHEPYVHLLCYYFSCLFACHLHYVSACVSCWLIGDWIVD